MKLTRVVTATFLLSDYGQRTMIDFTPIRNKQMTLMQLAAGFERNDLRRETNDMIDHILGLIADYLDADVVFEPSDPEAKDEAAATEGEVYMPWTLGHVIVHTTASAEEAAFIAAELARGVPFHGRSRSEVAWQTVTTMVQCRARLEESRRMRLAMLDVWPDAPNLELTYKYTEQSEPRNAISRFLAGLMHDDSHLGHVAEIVRQAKAARSGLAS